MAKHHLQTTMKPLFCVLLSFFVLVSRLSTTQADSYSYPSSPNVDKFLSCLKDYCSHEGSSISKAIYTPDNNSFTSVLRSYIRNERFNQSNTPKPLAIVTALEESHVQATVICAKKNGLQLRTRSGGHDYEGLSYVSKDPFVLLDMFNLRSIDIDQNSETAWAQAGATLGELYYKISTVSKELAFPAGVCPTIGLGGHISGGGYGNMMRKYGLSVDNVLDAKVVDAKGNILDRNSMGEDLFWAIRGGGGASFGVVLAWKLKLVRVPETVTVFNVGRTLEQGATDIVDQWQRVAPKMYPELFIRAQPLVLKGEEKGNKTIEVRFIAQYLGGAKQLLSYMNQAFPLLRLQEKDCIEMPWVNSTLFWYAPGAPVESLTSRVSQARSSAKFRSDYVQEPVPKAGWEAIWKKLLEVEVIFMQFNAYGGKMSEVPSDATPFPHRAGNLFKIQYLAVWSESGDEVANQYTSASKQVYDTFAPYVSKNPREHFLNYRDIDIGTNDNGADFGTEYFKGNWPRLVSVKKQVDPDNFFRYEQSVPLSL